MPDGKPYAEHEIRPPRGQGRPNARLEVWTSSLPSPKGSTFGRDDELHALHEHWANDRTHVVAVVGWGGSGKSQLVASWLAGLAPSYGDAERVFGWSFYAQGTSPRAAVSSEEFFDKAFSFFGGQPKEKDALGRAHELARLIRAQPTLLVLDGLEPLQDPASGGVREPALRYLLKELVACMNGICIVTTRPPFTELDGFEGGTFRRITLPPLGPEAGVELLRDRGVRGSDLELRATVEEYRGHALSLAVLGKYLADARNGDIRQCSCVGLTEEDVNDERRIWRVLTSHDAYLGLAPRQILRAVALFDRPAPTDCLHVLRRGHVLPGASDASTAMDEPAWNKAVSALQRADLLSPDDRPGTLDAHPLVRAHFARAFEVEDGGAFRAAHGLLFEHLRALAPPLPTTLDGMLHLYQAVAHGCRAQRWDEAFEVLHDRIRQGKEHVSLHKLGAVSADLAAFACFFSEAWEPASDLSPQQRHWLQNSAGVLHRAEGNIEEARRLLAAAVETAPRLPRGPPRRRAYAGRGTAPGRCHGHAGAPP